MTAIRRPFLLFGVVALILGLAAAFSGAPTATRAVQPVDRANVAKADTGVQIREIGPSLTPAFAPDGQTALFDSLTGSTPSFTTSVPRTYMGQPFNLAATGPITGVRFLLVSTAAATYTNIQVRLQFWDTFDSAGTLVYTTTAGPVIVANLGANTVAANTAYQIDLTLGAPVNLTGLNNHGVTFNIRADTGSGPVDAANLTVGLRITTPFAVGSVPLPAPNYGYLRNASGRTDFNFVPGDIRNIGANSAIGMILFTGDGGGTPTPTPTTGPGTITPTATVTPTITPGTPTATVTPTITPGTPTVTTVPTGTVTTTPGTPTVTPGPSCALTEGFDAITTLPGAGWSLQNLSSPLGTTGWFQGNPTVFPSHTGALSSYIGANFNNTGSVGTIDNWLLTPVQSLSNGSTLKFWSRIPAGNEFPDRLEVRMSTAGASTTTTDFTTVLLTINPDLVTGVYPKVWTEFTATVTGLAAPTTGRFAFRYFVTDGGLNGTNSNYIGIDTLSYCAGNGGTPTVTTTPGTPTNTPVTPTATNTPVTPTATNTATPTITSTPTTPARKLYLPLLFKN